MVGCEGVGNSHQNPVLCFAAPGVLLDGSHKLNGLLVQHLSDALWREKQRKKGKMESQLHNVNT